MQAAGQIVVRYQDNFNGSTDAIAGVCDASGLVFGLMPHPERFLDWTRHPSWTRLPKATLATTTPGLRIFQNAVSYVQTRASHTASPHRSSPQSTTVRHNGTDARPTASHA
jgi:phosphoribosylformylglycinamidine (FGAM) synthase-like amidotransferase family enzyme